MIEQGTTFCSFFKTVLFFVIVTIMTVNIAHGLLMMNQITSKLMEIDGSIQSRKKFLELGSKNWEKNAMVQKGKSKSL